MENHHHNDPFAPLSEAEKSQAQPQQGDGWTPISPIPTDAPKLTREIIEARLPVGFRLTAAWRYLDGKGGRLCTVVRADRPANGAPAGRMFLPFTYCEGPNGRREWRSKGLLAPRPLYHLDILAAHPQAPVLVTEGEKSADAAAQRFPAHVAVTSLSGAKSAGKADWSPLRGRRVTIWPDNDDAGRAYAAEAAALARQAGAQSVAIVATVTAWPDGWDLADDLPAGVDDGELRRMLEAATDPDAWPAPAPITSSLPHVAPFAPELLPEDLRAYVFDVAERQQSPVDFVAVAALAGLATVVGNRIRIAPKQFDDWQIVPNLFAMIVGPPSAMKSPAMKSGLAPIFAIEADLREDWEKEQKEKAVGDVLSALDAKEAKRAADKAVKAGDRDEARKILANLSQDDDSDEAPCPRLVVNDATVEKLGELLNQNERGLLLVRDELPGFLAQIEAEDRQSERAFYLEAFNGDGKFVFDRIGRGTVPIEHATLSIIGGIQPSRIGPIVRGAVSGQTNDGLIQRFQLAVWPDLMKAWSYVDRRPDPNARANYEAVFRHLYALDCSTSAPATFRFTPEAQAMFRGWMEELHADARSGNLSPVMESHLLKMPKTVTTLALIFSLAMREWGEVGVRPLAMALGWYEYLRSHANRIYAAGNNVVDDAARLIVERRSQLPGEFTARHIQRKEWAGMADREIVSAAIDRLIETHHCREAPRPSISSPGRPTTVYVWNPALREGEA